MNNEVKLSKAELATLSLVPVEQRAALQAAMLKAKVERAEKQTKAREEFSLSLSLEVKQQDGTVKPGGGGVKILGLGMKFPLTLDPDQIDILNARWAEIMAFTNANREASKVQAAKQAAWYASQKKSK